MAIRKRGDVYQFTVEGGIDPKTGKRVRITRSGFKTKKEAQLAASAVEREVVDGTFVKEADVSFPDMADEWFRVYSMNAKPSTARVRQYECKKLKTAFAMIDLKKITKKMYQDFLIDLSNDGLSTITIEGIHAAARMIFKRAMELDLLKADPTEYAKLPKKQVTVEELESNAAPVKFMEKDQLKSFLLAAKQSDHFLDYPIFLLLAYTGIRVGELCALKWRDINFEEHTISITKTYYNPSNKADQYMLLTPKTKTSVRTIDIDPEVLNELKRLRLRYKEIKMERGIRKEEKDFVIMKTMPEWFGYPETTNQIKYWMRRLLKVADLDESLSPHSLRHTHTSLLAEAGVGLQEIMDRLGHKDDDVTKSVYMHCTKTMKKNTAQKFSALMGKI